MSNPLEDAKGKFLESEKGQKLQRIVSKAVDQIEPEEERPPHGWAYIRCSHQDSADSMIGLNVQKRQVDAYYELIQTKRRPEEQLTWGGYFVDEVVSAYKRGGELMNRPAGRDLMKVVRPGDTILIARLDRAFRSAWDCSNTIQRIWQPKGIDVHFVNPQVDLTTAEGMLVIQVLSAVAEMESRMKSDRGKEVVLEQKARGYAYNKPPYGFKNVGPRGKKRQVPCEVTRAVGDLIVHLHENEGLSYDEIHRRAAEEEAKLKHLRAPRYMKWDAGKVRKIYHKHVRLLKTESLI